METPMRRGRGRGKETGTAPGPSKSLLSPEDQAAVEKPISAEVLKKLASVFVIDGGCNSAATGEEELPPGFLLPKEVNISNKGDFIQEGSVIPCVASAIFSPSLIYLVFETDYFREMEDFINSMSSKYSGAWKDDCRDSLTVHPDHMEVGSMFAVSTIKETTKEPEWLRCKLIDKGEGPTGNKFRSLDLGLDVGHGDSPVAYLHKNWCEKPSWAIKCRLQLSPNFDKFHSGMQRWRKGVTKMLCRSLFEQALLVKFLRQFKQDGETMWEVSLQFATPVDGFDLERPIETQILEKTQDIHKEKVANVNL